MSDDELLPSWVTWQQRPFPDANLLLLHGRDPVMVDSGFVGHAEDTADPTATFTKALRRGQRLVDDPEGAVWYAARRIFGFALMIRDGIPAEHTSVPADGLRVPSPRDWPGAGPTTHHTGNG